MKFLFPSIIHPDQMGFILGREARDNSIMAIHWACAHNHLLPYPILSADAEKALDWVDWSFIQVILVKMGLCPHTLSWISALYTSPTARFKVNGSLSSMFPIWNVTRQGCPPLPLLFALTLEPLLRIWANLSIRDIVVGSMECKLSAYAMNDDILFHVFAPFVLPPKLLAECV